MAKYSRRGFIKWLRDFSITVPVVVPVLLNDEEKPAEVKKVDEMPETKTFSDEIFIRMPSTSSSTMAIWGSLGSASSSGEHVPDPYVEWHRKSDKLR
jgi:hypothetical protein